MKNFTIFILICLCQCVGYSQNAQKPNIIIILADDLGYADVGFNGCKDIPTPNIDRIANEGVKFTNAYVTFSVCGPSRAGLLTGRYPQRFGYERNPQYRPHDPNMGLPKTEQTLAEALKQVGYTSGIVGKWHQGADISNHPLNRGFQEFFGHLGGGHAYFPEQLTIQDSYAVDNDEGMSYKTWIMRNQKPIQTKKYLTDEFSDEAVQFVERNKKEPFFLYLSYNAPHSPLQATQEYLDRFPNIEDKKRKTYAAMVSAVDDGVGRLLDKLEALHLDSNTLVYFLSDNGGPENDNSSDNGVLRAGKSSVYEGGFHVPFAMQWKGTVKPTVYDNPVSSLDIFATIAALSKAPIIKDKPLDGVNLIPFITGNNKAIPHETIYLRKFDEKKYAVRHNDLKLVLNKDNEPELYNLKEDIGEINDIAKQFPTELQKMDNLRKEWDSQLIEPIFEGLIMKKNKQIKSNLNQNETVK
ncbi:sulfatase family protein [Flavobacterium nackdongense]|uniref:N-acetylgalactosamine 6-sulfate sulfatase n=1 Tax=Flavobacterium nackdongense TaxID=2547394 RepID=A0A4P6YB35_9FLAO|nr:sulfatase-like hydrolase/transferase [Flavobacterium nackdongense]QBN20316.1 N-acetylgalactosamine 6-sulfate sulfatase [Flavobacterium nackdongense]